MRQKMKETIYNIEKKKVAEFDLADDIFGSAVNKVLLYDAVKHQRASRRQGDAASCNRALVSGSTRKIYRQKGTGRARHSDRKANIFVGGGKAFGPHPRDYTYSMPVKARRGAFRSMLAMKHNEGKLLIVDRLVAKDGKTAPMAAALKGMGVGSALIVHDSPDENLRRSVRNIKMVKLVCSDGVNLLDALKYDYLVVTPPALDKIQERVRL